MIRDSFHSQEASHKAADKLLQRCLNERELHRQTEIDQNGICDRLLLRVPILLLSRFKGN